MCPCFQGHPKWFQFFQGQPTQHQQRATGVSSKLIQCCLSFSRTRANQWVTVLKFNNFFSESSTSMLQMVLATFLKCCVFSQDHPKCYGFFQVQQMLQFVLATSLKCCSVFQVQQMLQVFRATSLKCCHSTNVAVFSSHFPEELRFFPKFNQCCGFF